MIIYNDNELLYYYSENDEFALNIIFEKYKPLIVKKLNDYKVKTRNFEDFFQECQMALFRSIERFRPDKNVSFYAYTENTLNYCIRNTLKKESEYFYNVSIIENEIIDLYKESPIQTIQITKNNHYDFNYSLLESKVCKYLNDGFGIEYISQNINKTTKSVYNAIRRIKSKNETKENLKEVIVNNINKDMIKVSNLEKNVYRYYSCGYKPNEISAILSLEISTVYNALKRVKNKSRLKQKI